MKKMIFILSLFFITSCASTSSNEEVTNSSKDRDYVKFRTALKPDEEKKALERASSQLEELEAYNSKKKSSTKITKRNSAKKNDNSDVWFALLSLLNDSWNPKKPQIDKDLMDGLSSDLFKDYYSNPNESMINVPLTKGSYSLGSYLGEFMIRDLGRGKVYKGRWNLTGEEVLFDNGMTGKFDSNGNFIFSTY